MARKRENELFIGTDYLNIEGRSIKHPALIKVYGTANVNKIREEHIDLIGLDLETNHLTAELKLLGFYYNNKYEYTLEHFLENLFGLVRYADKKDISIAYWNKLDPFVLYKQFLLRLPPVKQEWSMKRFGKIAGEWSKKYGMWQLQPVVEVEMPNNWMFGIKNVIRSSVQFFYYRKDDNIQHTVWAYDIAGLYQNGLETEALGKYNEKTKQYEGGRLPYYSKLGEEYHKIDWNRFETDTEFRKNVLYSNELDARAVRDLGLQIQEDFKIAFKCYPKTLISQGSLARSAIVATLNDKYSNLADTERSRVVYEEVKSIGWLSFWDYIVQTVGSEISKELYALVCESYSGGYIESIRYGYTEEAWTADLSSAYPSTIVELMDLRHSKITNGTGDPPTIPNSYCFIRGTVNIPLHINYHPITVKHYRSKETNIRAVGEYKASYTLEERTYLINLGATFKDEMWINVECTGELSPLAHATTEFVKLRKRFIEEKNSAQFMAKIASNSVYGITFEAVDTFADVGQEVERMGYRAGEFFNPLYAAIITSRTRLKLSRACQEVENKGGKPILIMTDSILWKGTFDMLPSDMWRDGKVLGYFEKPELVKDVVCLGSGRYEYTDSKGRKQAKKRGLNASDLHNENGIDITEFSWINALKSLQTSKKTKITVNVRTLLSVGLVLHNNSYNVKDLGLVKEEVREVDLLVGKNKRNYDENKLKNPKILATQLVDTESLVLQFGMNGKQEIVDQTLPILREEMMKREVYTLEEKRKNTYKDSSKKYREKNKELLNKQSKDIYNYLRDMGYETKEAKKMSRWSLDRIENKLKGDGKL